MKYICTLVLALALTGCTTTKSAPETIHIEATAPTAGYLLTVEAVHEQENVLHILARALPPEGMAAQVLSNISTTILVTTEAQHQVIYVLGPSTLSVPNRGRRRYVILHDRNAYDRAVVGAREVPFER